jgi:hypothetical protein
MNKAIRRLMANSKKEIKNVHFKCFEYSIYDINIKSIVILGKGSRRAQRAGFNYFKNSPGDTKRKVHLPFNLNGYS